MSVTCFFVCLRMWLLDRLSQPERLARWALSRFSHLAIRLNLATLIFCPVLPFWHSHRRTPHGEVGPLLLGERRICSPVVHSSSVWSQRPVAALGKVKCSILFFNERAHGKF